MICGEFFFQVRRRDNAYRELLPAPIACRSCVPAMKAVLCFLCILLKLCRVFAAVSAAAAQPAATKPAQPSATWSLPAWDDGLHHGVLLASESEWSLYFRNSSAPGLLHVWTRCVVDESGGILARSYLATQSGGDRARYRLMHGGQLHSYTEPLVGPQLTLDGVAAACVFGASEWADSTVRADCRTQLPTRAAAGVVAVVGVVGWDYVYALPLRLCSPRFSGPRAPPRRVLHVYEKQGSITAAEDTSRNEAFVATFEKHLAHAMCQLGVQRYEVTMHEKFLPLVQGSAALAAAVEDGRLVILLKPAFPNEVRSPPSVFGLDFLMTVNYNLALLRHWVRPQRVQAARCSPAGAHLQENNTFVFFLDFDEFLIFRSDQGRRALSELVATSDAVEFPRRDVVCTSCPPRAPRDFLNWSVDNYTAFEFDTASKLGVAADAVSHMGIHSCRPAVGHALLSVASPNASLLMTAHFRNAFGARGLHALAEFGEHSTKQLGELASDEKDQLLALRCRVRQDEENSAGGEAVADVRRWTTTYGTRPDSVWYDGIDKSWLVGRAPRHGNAPPM